MVEPSAFGAEVSPFESGVLSQGGQMEEWRELNYNGEFFPNYEISSLGRLRNSKTKKVIKLNITGEGYLGYCASLGHRKLHKMLKIHRAVACTFLTNKDFTLQVNHIDGNKTNNRADNLEWVTGSSNVKHAYVNGLMKPCCGINNPHSKLSEKDAVWIKRNAREYGIRKTARKFGVSHTVILGILNNERWKHIVVSSN